MEFSEAVRRRHMTRNFQEARSDRSVVDGLLADALAGARRPETPRVVSLVVLEGTAQTDRYWEATTDADWRARSRRYEGLSRAPVVVLAFSDPDAYADRYAEPDKVRGRRGRGRVGRPLLARRRRRSPS